MILQKGKKSSVVLIALVVAMGFFLMGFDPSVISGIIKFIEPGFNLSKIELGWEVTSFAVSLGPVMWVLFSELFPNKIRGMTISFIGFVNSAVSFWVQLVSPWELAKLGSTGTFLLYGVFALTGLIVIVKLLPETKGKSLEELEAILVKQKLHKIIFTNQLL